MLEYQKNVNEKWKGVRENEWRGVEEEWDSFKEEVNRSAVEVCSMKRVRGRGINPTATGAKCYVMALVPGILGSATASGRAKMVEF